MEHQMIAALVLAEHGTDGEGAVRAAHDQRRFDALRERDRSRAARARADRWRRVRAALAVGIRRIAEIVEPPRPVCVAGVPDPC